MKKSISTIVVAVLMTMSLNAQETCPACNGSGKSSAVIYPPTFGLGRSIMKESCPYCSDIYSHTHKNCPRCRGTGKVQSNTNSHDYSHVFNNENIDYNAYVYLGIAVASVFIFSNDIYVYPVTSFYKSGEQTDGSGWTFGLRKTFNYSALEYGASYLKSTTNYGYGYSEPSERWGAHFDFVQQIFYNKTPDWLRIYIGPSVNYVYDFGYGAIIGTEMRLFNRLKFDIRYERTTQTNQLQAGLIFTYQK